MSRGVSHRAEETGKNIGPRRGRIWYDAVKLPQQIVAVVSGFCKAHDKRKF